MNHQTPTHIALRVLNLREAEHFYSTLFKLEVAWREAETSAGWCSLPPGKTWDDTEAAGIELGLVMMYRDHFALALERAEMVQPFGTLSHIGILVTPEHLAWLRDHAPAVGCTLVHSGELTVVFDDPYGVRWEPTVIPYTDPVQFSSGVRLGKWLAV